MIAVHHAGNARHLLYPALDRMLCCPPASTALVTRMSARQAELSSQPQLVNDWLDDGRWDARGVRLQSGMHRPPASASAQQDLTARSTRIRIGTRTLAYRSAGNADPSRAKRSRSRP
ncbi:hypothetical protein L1887_53227 [Cichorium endivia]|nr:hypothetical protein L1887_53227 [Cichorium endivia]